MPSNCKTLTVASEKRWLPGGDNDSTLQVLFLSPSLLPLFSRALLFQDCRDDILDILKLQPTKIFLAWEGLRICSFPGVEYIVRNKLTQMFLSNFLVN